MGLSKNKIGTTQFLCFSIRVSILNHFQEFYFQLKTGDEEIFFLLLLYKILPRLNQTKKVVFIEIRASTYSLYLLFF